MVSQQVSVNLFSFRNLCDILISEFVSTVQRQVLNGQELLLDKLQEIRKVCGLVLLVLGIWKTLKVMCLYKHSTRKNSCLKFML